MKILISGSSGLVGRALIPHLTDGGHKGDQAQHFEGRL